VPKPVILDVTVKMVPMGKLVDGGETVKAKPSLQMALRLIWISQPQTAKMV
jgi:hypothetical protein